MAVSPGRVVSSNRERAAVSESEPGFRGLWLGILAYRWATFVWMAIAAIVIRADLRRPALALFAVLLTFAWNVWFSLTAGWRRTLDRGIDLGLAFVLLPLSGWVMDEGAVTRTLFFATSYPATAALTTGAGSGVAGGLSAGVLLSIGLALSRTANGVPLTELDSGQWAALVNGAFYYLSAGGAAGVVRRVLVRSAAERAGAIEDAARQRERAARLAERESLGRRIHDSVLQALTMITKRGAELTARSLVPSEEVDGLVELARQQERALRALIQTEPEEPPEGTVSLRTVLEAAAFGVQGVPVSITTVDSIWLPSEAVDEVSAAVHHALENVTSHARASRASLFAEIDGDQIVITVRDDGAGFIYDEEQLRRDGKLGVLGSMKGRVEDLGGSMRIETSPGKGTEVEFRLPRQRRDG